jgi:cardiolipin synthase
MKWRYLPNMITTLRLIMVIPFLYFTFKENYPPALFIFLIASFSDGLDGYLARRFQWQSKLGAFCDPLADKVLVISSYVALTINHQLPLWFTLLIVSRDVAISIASIWCVLSRNVEFRPSTISKVNTVFQLIVIVTVLVQLSCHQVPARLIDIMVILTALTTIYSFIDYAICWTIKVFIRKNA